MKKLMMAAAIVCAAVGVQAAQFDWSFDRDDLMGSYAVADSATYYIVNAASGVAGTLASTLTTSGADAFTKALEDGGYVYQTGKFTNGGGSGLVLNSNADFATIFVINDGLVADAAFAYAEYDASGNIYTPPTGKDPVFMSASDWGDPDYASSWGAGTIAAVPEPTSGLLLLLGVAGLALRRRRA